LDARAVEADTGAIGGQLSHEFMVLAETGEEGMAECDHCDYAANVEKAQARTEDALITEGAELALEEVATPHVKTCSEVSAFLKRPQHECLKTLIYVVDDEPVAVVLPGDRNVHQLKLLQVFESKHVELAPHAIVEQVTGAAVGYAGPYGLSIPIYADQSLEGAKGMVTGANKEEFHHINVDLDRDAKVTGYYDFCEVREGDGCPRCSGKLLVRRGIELGHVFKLGTKYSQVHKAMYLDAEGKKQPLYMGCYGIGISRTLQAVIEQAHDEGGLCWPMSIAPYQVEVLVLNTSHDESVKAAEALIAELEGQGIEVLYDDRDERPGVKFKDADLIGIPLRVAIGVRSLAEGLVEIKRRGQDEVEKVAVGDAVQRLVGMMG